MLLAGIVGPATTCKAMYAALAGKGQIDIYPDLPHGPNEHRLLYDSAGYQRNIGKVALGTWQMILVSKSNGFMPNRSSEALWQRLNSDQYTTPLLRSWLPWIERKLQAAELLVPLRCFNCECGWLKATSDDLDEIVSEGLRTKKLVIA